MEDNTGEGIAIAGIMIATAISNNYWLLCFTLLPSLTWMIQDKTLRDKSNNIIWRRRELEITKLQEEVRLLKNKKK